MYNLSMNMRHVVFSERQFDVRKSAVWLFEVIRKCWIMFWLVSFFISSASWAGEPLQIAIFEYPPLLSKGIEGYGVEPEIVTAAFRQVNIEVQYIFFPPARALETTKNDNFDATLGWVWSEEREQAFYYSDALINAPLVFFH